LSIFLVPKIDDWVVQKISLGCFPKMCCYKLIVCLIPRYIIQSHKCRWYIEVDYLYNYLYNLYLYILHRCRLYTATQIYSRTDVHGTCANICNIDWLWLLGWLIVTRAVVHICIYPYIFIHISLLGWLIAKRAVVHICIYIYMYILLSIHYSWVDWFRREQENIKIYVYKYVYVCYCWVNLEVSRRRSGDLSIVLSPKIDSWVVKKISLGCFPQMWWYKLIVCCLCMLLLGWLKRAVVHAHIYLYIL